MSEHGDASTGVIIGKSKGQHDRPAVKVKSMADENRGYVESFLGGKQPVFLEIAKAHPALIPVTFPLLNVFSRHYSSQLERVKPTLATPAPLIQLDRETLQEEVRQIKRMWNSDDPTAVVRQLFGDIKGYDDPTHESTDWKALSRCIPFPDYQTASQLKALLEDTLDSETAKIALKKIDPNTRLNPGNLKKAVWESLFPHIPYEDVGRPGEGFPKTLDMEYPAYGVYGFKPDRMSPHVVRHAPELFPRTPTRDYSAGMYDPLQNIYLLPDEQSSLARSRNFSEPLKLPEGIVVTPAHVSAFRGGQAMLNYIEAANHAVTYGIKFYQPQHGPSQYAFLYDRPGFPYPTFAVVDDPKARDPRSTTYATLATFHPWERPEPNRFFDLEVEGNMDYGAFANKVWRNSVRNHLTYPDQFYTPTQMQRRYLTPKRLLYNPYRPPLTTSTPLHRQ